MLLVFICASVFVCHGLFARGESQCVHSSVCVYFPSAYEERKQTHNQISSESRGRKGEEMRLQLITSLAADVLHKSSPLHPGCFHGDGTSHCEAPVHSPVAPSPHWRRGGDPVMGSSDLFIPPPHV